MLLYHPATDFYHCWMRFASVLCDGGLSAVEYDRMRVIDFFLCFPKEVGNCAWAKEMSIELRRATRLLSWGYQDPASIRQAFPSMSKIHNQVVMDLVSKGIIERKQYSEGLLSVARNNTAITLLQSITAGWESRNESWYKPILSNLLSIPLHGEGGLKARSGLLEFRYDA